MVTTERWNNGSDGRVQKMHVSVTFGSVGGECEGEGEGCGQARLEGL